MAWVVRHPIGSFLLMIFFCLAFAPGLKHLKLDSSSNGLIVQKDPEKLYYDEVKKIFGDDVTETIIIKSEDIFTQLILQSIEDLTLDIEYIDGVTRVVSLSTSNNLRGTEDGYLITDVMLPYVPEDIEEIKELRAKALSNELLHGEVISPDGKVAAIQVFVESRSDDPQFEEKLTSAIEELLKRERAKLGTDVVIYQIGPPLTKVHIIKNISKDITLLTPLSMLTVGVVLLLFFRSFSSILLPVVTGATSIIVTMGFMGFCGFAINPVTVVIPSLLLVIGSTEDIHLIAEYAMGLRSQLQKREAVLRMAVKSGLAIFLTSLTTFVGFLTVAPNSLPMLSEFGITASFGIAANFILTAFLAPAVLLLLKAPKSFQKEEAEFLSGLTKFLISLAVHHRIKVISISFFIAATSLFLSSKIVVDTDYLQFFRDDSVIKKSYIDMSKNFSGGTIFFVTVDTGRENGIQDPLHLKQIAKLTDFIKERHENVISYDQFIRKTHKEMNGGNPDFYQIPDDADLISQYSLMIKPSTLERFADFDYQRANLLVRSRAGGSRGINNALPEIREFVQKICHALWIYDLPENLYWLPKHLIRLAVR